MEELDRFTIEKAARGNEMAFRRLYDHYAPFVWRVAYRSAGGDRTIAEEIVQETFIRVSRSLKSFAADSSLGTWIYRIAYNAGMTLLTQQQRQRESTVPFVEELAVGPRTADRYETKELVNLLLDELQADERFILVAREVDGLSFEEIAEITGKTSEALRTRMFRIKAKVKEIMSEKYELKEMAV
jgi:RNA polymerase sigma-70 factor, ECF subfamily